VKNDKPLLATTLVSNRLPHWIALLNTGDNHRWLMDQLSSTTSSSANGSSRIGYERKAWHIALLLHERVDQLSPAKDPRTQQERSKSQAICAIVYIYSISSLPFQQGERIISEKADSLVYCSPIQEVAVNEQSSVQFTENKALITLYIDSSKTFTGLSAGALALTVTLQDKILGHPPGTPVSCFMLVSWAFYLLAIGSSAMYQYLAIKFLDSFSRVPGATGWFKSLKDNPGLMYGVMLGSFFLGSLFLIIAATRSIPLHW
jgi:hypothetical protein